jgi:hypothetical protein
MTLFTLCLATVAPTLVFAAVSALLLPGPLLTDIAAPEAMESEAPGLLAALMSDMKNLALGLLVAAWFVYRRAVIEQAERRHLAMVALATFWGLASIFCGLRGQYALAFVVATQPFRLALLSGFIEAQAVLLVLQLMTVSLLASHFLIFRDRRTNLSS